MRWKVVSLGWALTLAGLALAPRPVAAGGVVSPCSEQNLRNALAGGGMVTFDCGPATITLGSPLVVTANTTLDGGGQITLSGGGATGVFVTQAGLSVTLRNLSIVNARSSDQGAALRTGSGNILRVENVTFVGNVSLRDAAACDGGGALFIGAGSTAVVQGSTFTDNQAQNGGAINSLRSDLTLLDNVFTNNRALHSAAMDSRGDCGGGGAVYIDGANSFGKPGLHLLQRNIFTGNRANNHGGAIFLGLYSNETVTIDQAYFNGNRAERNTQGQAGTGGALWFGPGDPAQAINSLTLSNATFYNNHADTQGGGLWLDGPARLANTTFISNDATNPASLAADDWRRGNGGAIVGAAGVEVDNSTLVGNTAGFNGGAFAGSGTSPTSPIVVRNTLIANNTGGNPWGIQQQCTSQLINGGNSLQWPDKSTNNWNDYNCVSSLALSNPALTLGPLADNGGYAPTLALLPGSPALNAGNPVTCTGADQRGLSRSLGGVCDIGAYEAATALAVSPPVVAVSDPGLNLTVLGDGFTNGQPILWNGTPMPTTFVNRFTLTASVAPSAYAAPGTVVISVSGSPLAGAVLQVWPALERLYLPLARR